MKSNRIWAIGTVIIVLAVVGLGWVLGISPKLAEAAATSTTADQVDAENLALQQQIVLLKAAYENIDAVRDELDELEASLPPTADIPDFIRQINTIASTNGVVLNSISTGTFTVYSPQVESVVPEVAAATAVMGPTNLVLIPITIKMTGGDAALINFNDALQTGDERLFLVTNFVVQNGQSVTQPPPTVIEDGEVVPPPALIFSGEVTGYIFVVLNPNVAFDETEGDDAENPAADPTPAPSEPVPTPTPTETVSALRR